MMLAAAGKHEECGELEDLFIFGPTPRPDANWGFGIAGKDNKVSVACYTRLDQIASELQAKYELHPVKAPSNTQGAVKLSHRSAPRNVIVRQRPCGAKPRRRSPFGAHPRNGAILVLIQVSSMKTRRCGSRLACHDRQRRRLRATSERPCSRANSVFFEPQPLPAQE